MVLLIPGVLVKFVSKAAPLPLFLQPKTKALHVRSVFLALVGETTILVKDVDDVQIVANGHKGQVFS